MLLPLTAFGGPTVLHWNVDGVGREALVFPPAQASPAANVPVLFVFHPHGGTSRSIADRMKLDGAWPEALIVSMQGLLSPGILGDVAGRQSGWQFTPGQSQDRDLKFFDTVLSSLAENFPVDKGRIFATGASNGGFFTYLLWAERPEVFRALAAGACKLLPEVKLTKALPVLHFAADEDMRVLLREQQETIAVLRKINSCVEQGVDEGASMTRYASSQGTPVHAFVYPGSHTDFEPALAVTLAFFKEQAAKP